MNMFSVSDWDSVFAYYFSHLPPHKIVRFSYSEVMLLVGQQDVIKSCQLNTHDANVVSFRLGSVMFLKSCDAHGAFPYS